MTKTLSATKLTTYAVNLRKWMSQAQIKVVEASTVKVSKYTSSDENNGKPLIELRVDCDAATKGHEYGHSIFDAVFKEYGMYPDCTFIKFYCKELEKVCNKAEWKGVMNIDDMIMLDLDDMREQYGVEEDDLAPVSDIMGMYVDKEIPGYMGHRSGYAEEFEGEYNGENHIYEDEWFAHICGLINTENWKAINAIHDRFPDAVETCFDVINKAMKILKKANKRKK